MTRPIDSLLSPRGAALLALAAAAMMALMFARCEKEEEKAGYRPVTFAEL